MKKISWFEIGLEANKNKKFFIKGTALGEVTYYGPYTLVDAHKRIMKNKNGNTFMHYAEDFCYDENDVTD